MAVAAAKSHVTARVLLIDDDDAICGLVSKYLQHHGHTVDVLHDGRELDRALGSPFDVVLLDMGLPGIDGLSILDRLSREHPEVAVVMITAATGVDSIVDAMRRGAFDYLTKPLDLQRLAIVVRNAAEHTRLRLESDGLRAAMLRGDGGPHLICGSQAMSEVISLVERVAASRVPVLIYGEAGVGKELVAHRIHARSRRRDGPFVVVNCAQKPAEVLGEKLFGGPEAGGLGGKFEEARGGTLFLDEVGELSPELQTRLQRALHEASLQDRRGDGADVRVIAATVKHLPTEVSRGTFRADLFYRLNVFSITVPPLKDRRDDIPALARYALARFAARENQPPPSLSDEVLEALMTYGWPGNVRELNNTVERMALVASGGIIKLDDLPDDIRAHSATFKREEPRTLVGVYDEDDKNAVRPLHEVEREMMIAALRETEGNVSEAARRLGIGRATFYRRAQRHGLTREDGFPG